MKKKDDWIGDRDLSAAIEYSRGRRPPLKTRRKKPITSALLDERDCEALRKLLHDLPYPINSKERSAVERLAKKVGY